MYGEIISRSDNIKLITNWLSDDGSCEAFAEVANFGELTG